MIKLILILTTATILFANTKNIEKVSLQLHWKYQFEYAGFIIAKEKGFYKDIGFDVEIKEFNSNIKNVIDDIVNHKSTFGINDSLLMTERQTEDIVLLANYYKTSPLVIATSKDIQHPKDLENKNIMMPLLNMSNTPIDIMFKHLGVDSTTFKFKNHNFNIDQLINKTIDAMVIYKTNELYDLEKTNTPYNLLDPKDYGFSSGAVNLFTTQDNIDKYGISKIQAFIDASNKGWRYAFENIDETVDLIHSQYNHSLNKSKEALHFEAIASKKLFMLNDFSIGDINKQEMYRWYDILQNYSLIKDESRFKKFLFQQNWREIVYSKDEIIIYNLIIFIILGLLFSKYQRKQTARLKDGLELEKKLQHNTQVLLDESMEGIVISNSMGIITDMNSSSYKLLGYKEDKEDTTNRSLLEFVAPESISLVKEKLQNKDAKPYETKLICKDGTIIDVLMKGKTIEYNGQAHRISSFIDITKLKEKENLLVNQSRLAAMGEMIGVIAHQWRQPLNSLGIKVQTISRDYSRGNVDKEYLVDFEDKSLEIIDHMSSTIDDFRDFFIQDKSKNSFSTLECINHAVSILLAQLNSHFISVEITGEDFNVDGFETEFGQVILNIINNAKDILVEKNIKNPSIEIHLDSKLKTISIKDNAGGIPADIIDKIFEPYFSTKIEKNGTGIGLYMSKQIIQNNMGGTIDASNHSDGAVFMINLLYEGKQ